MKVEFLYFDLHGIGIIPRLAMAAGGIKFEDTRVTFPKGWPELKKSKFSKIYVSKLPKLCHLDKYQCSKQTDSSLISLMQS